MSFSLEELNRIFTPEGHAEAIESSTQGADAFPFPVAASDGGATYPASQPGTNQGVVSQQLAQQGQVDPELLSRMEQIGQQVNGVVGENTMLRQALARVGQHAQQQADAQWAAAYQSQQDPTAREQMLTQRFQEQYNNLYQQASQREQQLLGVANQMLVNDFTRDEVLSKYPNLSPVVQQLINGEPNPDRRAEIAAAFAELQTGNRQAATSAAAALHVASGAGRVGGGVPSGAADMVTADGRTPGRPKSALEILKETGYTARSF